MEKQMQIMEIIEHIRKEKKISVLSLAKNKSSYSRLLSGKQKLTICDFMIFCEKLGVNPSTIFSIFESSEPKVQFSKSAYDELKKIISQYEVFIKRNE